MKEIIERTDIKEKLVDLLSKEDIAVNISWAGYSALSNENISIEIHQIGSYYGYSYCKWYNDYTIKINSQHGYPYMRRMIKTFKLNDNGKVLEFVTKVKEVIKEDINRQKIRESKDIKENLLKHKTLEQLKDFKLLSETYSGSKYIVTDYGKVELNFYDGEIDIDFHYKFDKNIDKLIEFLNKIKG